MRPAKTVFKEFRRATLAQIETRLGPALPNQLFEKPKSSDHSRERIFPLYRTFWCAVWQVLQANTSCREVVRQVQALFALQNGRPVDESTGAYCQARTKLPLGLLEKAFVAAAKSADGKVAPSTVFHGRSVKVLDGTTVRLADTPANRKAYPPPTSMHPGCGFPLLKIVVLFSLSSGALIAKSIGNQFSHEVRLCEKLRGFFFRGDIIVADRAYPIFPIVAWLQHLGVDLIARVPTGSRRVDFRRARTRYHKGEGLFTWLKTRRGCAFLPAAEWLGLPEELTVRILRVQLHQAGFRTKRLTIMTTLLDPTLYPAHEIIAAYARRWRLEMSIDDLKTTLSMENLRARSPEMAQKELLLFFIAHNLLRWVMAEAARSQDVDLVRLSFKGTLDTFRQWTIALAQLGSSKRNARKRRFLWSGLLKSIAADLVPERPGRREPRAVKKRSKYPYMYCLRDVFRERLSRCKRRSQAYAKKLQNLN
jgi:hypothetical protein